MTILRPPVARQEPHRTIHRWLGGWPVWAHRLGLGRLVGRRYAVITTIGRRTGATRRAAVMVLRDDAATGEIWVIAGDARTGWYRRNLYFSGASTHPGTGLPIVLLSAKLATQRILAEMQPALRRRALAAAAKDAPLSP